MSKKAKYRLVEMETEEVSLVDIAANQRTFLIVKSGTLPTMYIRKIDEETIEVYDHVNDKSLATYSCLVKETAIEFMAERDSERRFIVEEADSSFKILDTETGKFSDEIPDVDEALKKAAILENKAQEDKLKDALPKEAYAYVGDENTTATWKLKLFEKTEDIPDTPSISLTAMAAQALTPEGFRGNQVQIPDGSLEQTKNIVAAAWLKARIAEGQTVTEENLPKILKSEEDVEKTEATILLNKAKDNVCVLAKCVADSQATGGSEAAFKAFDTCVRSVQSGLRKASGDISAPSITFDTSKLGSISFDSVAKEAVSKIFDEATKRIEKIEVSVSDCEILDTEQSAAILNVADVVAKVLSSIQTDTLVVSCKSIPDEDRYQTIDNIDKAITELSCLRIALGTNVDKTDVVGAEDIDNMVSSVVSVFDTAGEKPSIEEAINEADDVAKAKVAVMKMFQARYGNDGYIVVKVNPNETVAEFDTYDEAEFDALTRNVQAITSLAKAMHFKVKQDGDKYVVVDSSAGDKVVWTGDTEQEAKDKADELNMGDQETPEEDSAEPAASDPSAPDTAKSGAAMQKDRLNRLKAVVKMYKEALDDLLGGSKSLDKFQKIGSTLEQLVKELSDAKKSVNEIMGIDDKRDSTGAKPNVGAGDQPSKDDITDAASGLTGEGTPSLEALMKQVEELKKNNQEHGDIAKALRREVATLKKTRQAPTTIPSDYQTVQKSQQKVCWPSDMAAQSTV